MIRYEWDIETYAAPDGDVLDHHHATRLADFSREQIAAALAERVGADGHATRLVLVRDNWDAVEGLTNRQWAYAEGSTMPDAFDNGAMVPKKYLQEFAKIAIDGMVQ